MLPVICVSNKTIATAYEDALIQLKMKGIEAKTQYDKPGDPPSICATANITIEYPLEDPMIHKAFPGGIEDLREYVYELDGLKDDWVKIRNDKKDTRWEYTYHERFANWGTWMDMVQTMDGGVAKRRISPSYMDKPLRVNQIDLVLNKLKNDPFTRQAQMITYIPFLDKDAYDPPCLQRIWFYITERKYRYLNVNISFRSNDAWGAFFMNCFGLTMFIKENFLDKLEGVKMGRINWQADNFHIYGKDRKDFEERFIRRIWNSTIEDRTYFFYSPEIQEIWKESEKTILKRISEYNK